MSIREQLINDLTQTDFILYAIDKCNNLQQLEKYHNILSFKIKNIISQNDPFQKLLNDINSNICTQYCQSLKPHFLYLLEQLNRFEEDMSYQLGLDLTSKNKDKISHIIESESFFESFIEYIYDVCCRSNRNQGTNNMNIFACDIKSDIQQIFLDFYLNLN